VHVAIGLRGVDCSDKEVVAAAVLQSLLGGGDQFSAGGPGKGLTSRIFRNVLSNPEVLTATSFNVSYQDSGLFGIQVVTPHTQKYPKRPRTLNPKPLSPKPSTLEEGSLARLQRVCPRTIGPKPQPQSSEAPNP
jgi:hypothetical protein